MLRSAPASRPAALPDPERLVAEVCEDPSRVEVAFQPIVSLGHAAVTGYEALARFPGETPVPPDIMFAAAARTGLAGRFEAAVLERTLAARAALPPNCFYSLNVSPGVLLSDPVQAVLARQTSFAAIVIEITEQNEITDYRATAKALGALRDRGALIAVDDVGAGYASLAHVMALRPHFIKLDRALVTDCDEDETKRAAVEMLGTFASRVDAWVIAEGIERQGELDALARLGVPLAQGYLLSRPQPRMADLPDDVTASLAQRHSALATPGLLRLVEAVPVSMGSTDPGGALWVHADGYGRPLALVVDGAPRDIMVVVEDEALEQVALRAMTRPSDTRFDPIAVQDGQGRCRGVVAIDRLVRALAEPGA